MWLPNPSASRWARSNSSSAITACRRAEPPADPPPSAARPRRPANPASTRSPRFSKRPPRRSARNPKKTMTWVSACKKIGPGGKISETGANEARNPMGLNSGGAAGVQVADVSVDTETGLVKINRYVAVQDCGLIINPRLAESQVYGAIIMGISTALYEERIMDNATGRMMNSDMEFYKLAGIKDIGDIVVHLDIREVNDKRGVIGLGEPPAIGICAAVGSRMSRPVPPLRTQGLSAAAKTQESREPGCRQTRHAHSSSPAPSCLRAEGVGCPVAATVPCTTAVSTSRASTSARLMDS